MGEKIGHINTMNKTHQPPESMKVKQTLSFEDEPGTGCVEMQKKNHGLAACSPQNWSPMSLQRLLFCGVTMDCLWSPHPQNNAHCASKTSSCPGYSLISLDVRRPPGQSLARGHRCTDISRHQGQNRRPVVQPTWRNVSFYFTHLQPWSMDFIPHPRPCLPME